jgi:hypothetical protein
MPFVVVRRGARSEREILAYQWTPAPLKDATTDGSLVMFRVDDIRRADSQADRYASGLIGARACEDGDLLQTIMDMKA